MSASNWLDFQGRQLREASAQSPPRPPARLPLAENESADELRGKELQALFDHAEELSNWIESAAGSTGVAVLREQTSVLWWLNAGHQNMESLQLGFQSSIQLARFSLSPPPPARKDLFRRRLGESAEVEVTPEEFRNCRAHYPALMGDAEVLDDLLPLLNRGPDSAGPLLEITCDLYEEILIARLVRTFLEQEARQAAEPKAAESSLVTEEGGAG
jgi:hypothetical protein